MNFGLNKLSTEATVESLKNLFIVKTRDIGFVRFKMIGVTLILKNLKINGEQRGKSRGMLTWSAKTFLDDRDALKSFWYLKNIIEITKYEIR